MRRRLLAILGVAVLGVGVWQGSYWSRYLHLASGYAAKVAASAVFIAGRDLEHLRERELKPFSVLDVEIDRANHSVHVSALGLFGQTATARPGLGATLVHDGATVQGPVALDPPSAEFHRDWPEAELSAVRLAALGQGVDFAFQDPGPDLSWNTRAVVVIQRGQLLVERYGDRTDRDTPLHGWSMTKTITGVLCGLAVKDGLLEVGAKAPVPSWQDDERSAITVEHLLRMTSGLDFEESYSDPDSDALAMLFDSHDMAALVASRPLRAEPGTLWSYSSGDSLVLSGILHRLYGDEAIFRLARDRLFEPLGMTSARVEFDGSGTMVGSSMSWATARDWARFGEFLRLGGRWNGERILPEGFVEWMATPTAGSVDGSFGAHLWLNRGADGTRAWPSLPDDLFWCAGFEGQFVVVVPSKESVIVRLGQTFGQPEFPIETFVGAIVSALPD